MKSRNIPRTELNPSVVAFGAAQLGTGFDEATSYSLLDTYVEQGGNFIDTARVYGAWVPGGMGRSEVVIGKWLKERGNRDNIILATKGAHPNFNTMTIPRMSQEQIVSDIDDSLYSLQTDHIDLYWLHRDDPERSVADILDTLQEQVNLGKIRYFGCSNWSANRIEEAINCANHHNITGFVANQPMWSFARPNMDAVEDKTLQTLDDDGIALHKKTMLAIVPYSSQAHGYFTKASNNADQIPDNLRKIYDSVSNRERLSRLQKVAQETSHPISVLALAYLINQTVPTFPIIGCSHEDQLRESLQAGDVELSPETVNYLDGSMLSQA